MAFTIIGYSGSCVYHSIRVGSELVPSPMYKTISVGWAQKGDNLLASKEMISQMCLPSMMFYFEE